jgi:hypothetical protein
MGEPALILLPADAKEKAAEAESRGDHELASKLGAAADQAIRNSAHPSETHRD